MPSNDNERAVPKGTILVIDDDADVRAALCDTLEGEGHQVVQAASGGEALSWLRSHPAPALIFLDWNMVPMNATQFMEEFSKEPAFSHVPVVLVTADVHADRKAATSRYEGFIRKPINLDMLFSVVARFAVA